MMQNIDVLNLEWNSNRSRDREVVTLVNNYLRIQGLNVFEGAIFDGYRLIDKLKPKILYMSNSVGALLNLDMIRYAKSKGIVCVTGSAEGNFNEEGIEQFVWGVNKKKEMLEDACYLWSYKSYELAVKHYPHLKTKVGVCGAVGFDRYKIAKEDNKTELTAAGERYSLVVGVGCWNFDFTIEGSYCYRRFNGREIDENTLARFVMDRDAFNRELVTLIEGNPQTLFIIKLHPGCLEGDYSSAIEGVRKFENVVVGKDEFSVMQAISVSDIWLTYESTTAVEAWLMDTPTGLLNPSGIDFPYREGFHLGQPNFPNATEWGKAIASFQQNQSLDQFEKFSKARLKIITEIVQWDDGLNHVRMGNAILDLLVSSKPKPTRGKPSLRDRLKRLKRTLIWSIRRFLPYFSFCISAGHMKYAEWDYASIEKLSTTRLLQQVNFYKAKHLSKDKLRNVKDKI